MTPRFSITGLAAGLAIVLMSTWTVINADQARAPSAQQAKLDLSTLLKTFGGSAGSGGRIDMSAMLKMVQLAMQDDSVRKQLAELFGSPAGTFGLGKSSKGSGMSKVLTTFGPLFAPLFPGTGNAPFGEGQGGSAFGKAGQGGGFLALMGQMMSSDVVQRLMSNPQVIRATKQLMGNMD